MLFVLYLVALWWLLSDTEILEDVAQDFVGGDFAGNLAQVMEHFPDVLGQQVGWEGRGQAFRYPCEAFRGRFEGIIVPDVGYHHILVFNAANVHYFQQQVGRAINVLPLFSRKGDDSFVLLQLNGISGFLSIALSGSDLIYSAPPPVVWHRPASCWRMASTER